MSQPRASEYSQSKQATSQRAAMNMLRRGRVVGALIELLFVSISLYMAYRCGELVGTLFLDAKKFPESVPHRSISEFSLTLSILFLGVQAAVLSLPSLVPRPWSSAEKLRRLGPLGLIVICHLTVWGLMSAGFIEIALSR